MSNRISLYVGQALETMLGERVGPTRPPAKVINTMADRYCAVVRHYLPKFTAEEWLAIAEAAVQGNFTLSVNELKSLGGDLGYMLNVDGLAEKLGVDDSLGERLRELSFPEQIALADCIERILFAGDGTPEERLRQALADVGAS